MTQFEDAGSVSTSASPFATIWLNPRQTIERIVATRPTHLVLPLAILGAIGGFYAELLTLGLTADLSGWLWLGFIAASAVAGVIWLYVSAQILRWIGRLLGGEASALQLRAVLAWSSVPMIFGLVTALAVTVALHLQGVTDSWGVRQLLVTIFGVWSSIVFLAMLSRVEHFGIGRT